MTYPDNDNMCSKSLFEYKKFRMIVKNDDHENHNNNTYIVLKFEGSNRRIDSSDVTSDLPVPCLGL